MYTNSAFLYEALKEYGILDDLLPFVAEDKVLGFYIVPSGANVGDLHIISTYGLTDSARVIVYDISGTAYTSLDSDTVPATFDPTAIDHAVLTGTNPVAAAAEALKLPETVKISNLVTKAYPQYVSTPEIAIAYINANSQYFVTGFFA